MDNLTIIVPYYNGGSTIQRLLDTIPSDIPVLIIDDCSDMDQTNVLYQLNKPNVAIVLLKEKGYFTGAVNAGLEALQGDVLVLNQDAYFKSNAWMQMLEENRGQYAMIGECINGLHPAWPKGYIQGTFMYLRRDLISAIGLLNAALYPLWGSTCEYQLRAARAGFQVLPMRPVVGLEHDRSGRFGAAITTMLRREPDKHSLFIRTPPEVSVIVPCYNHGRYLNDLINSLIGGETSIGFMSPQTLQSFEIVIVDDCSTDKTPLYISQLVDPLKGIRSVRLGKNKGTANAINVGIQASFGRIITVLGADDMRESGSLQRLYEAQLSNPHSFVYDQIAAFADGQMRPDIKVRVRSFSAKDLIHKNHVHCGIMFPRVAWHEFRRLPNHYGRRQGRLGYERQSDVSWLLRRVCARSRLSVQA